MLPPPREFSAYPQHVQDRILAWQEDQVLGESRREHELLMAESKRQDDLVAAAITEGRNGQRIAAALYSVSLLASAALAWRGNNVGAAIALAPAVLGFLSRYLPTGRTSTADTDGTE